LQAYSNIFLSIKGEVEEKEISLDRKRFLRRCR